MVWSRRPSGMCRYGAAGDPRFSRPVRHRAADDERLVGAAGTDAGDWRYGGSGTIGSSSSPAHGCLLVGELRCNEDMGIRKLTMPSSVAITSRDGAT